MIPFIKTDQSIGKSIIQITGRKQASDFPTVVQIAEDNELKRVYLVDDHPGNLIPAYKELKKKDIQLCFGWRVNFVSYLTVKEEQATHKLVIFITSEAGYKKLVKLITIAQTTGDFKGTPRLDFNALHDNFHEDMVVCIPFYDSFLSQNLLTKQICIPDFRGLKPYVFLESNDLPFDSLIREAAERFAAENNLETVWGKSIYYDERKDLKAFMVKRLMNRKSFGTGNTIEEPNLDYFCSAEFCMESWRESRVEQDTSFEKRFDTPLELFLPGVRLPTFKLSKERQERYGLTDKSTPDEILRQVAREGMKDKVKRGIIPKSKIQEYADRAKYELDVLTKVKLAEYIGMVWDVTEFIKENKLSRNLARGSAAGSLINWLVGITGEKLDPLVYDLFFERFVNEGRVWHTEIDGAIYLNGALGDIDLDLGSKDREVAFEYVKSQYPNRVCKTLTLSTCATKKLVTEVCKILLNYNPDQAKLISDLIPVKFGVVASPRDAYEQSEDFKQFCDDNPEAFEICLKLHDSIVGFGKHASSVLVTYDELEYFMPLQLDSAGDIISSYDQNVVSEMAIKLDLLCVKAATVIYESCKAIGIHPDEIPLDDYENIYAPLQRLEHPYGLFQMGEAVQITAKQMDIRDMEGLSDCLALARPGSTSFLPKYIKAKQGHPESLHPIFDPILKKTGNTLLFQENILSCLARMGFTLKQADDVRRCLGKKKKEEMQEWERKIYEKAEENGIDKAAAKILWDSCNAAADYSFNKSFSFDTQIKSSDGIKLAKDIVAGDWIESFNTETKEGHYVEVLSVDIHEAFLWEVEFEDGGKMSCSMDHKFLASSMEMMALREVITLGADIVTKNGHTKPKKWTQIGMVKCLDFEVDHGDHNFYANGYVISNSHSLAYSATTAQTLWLKNKYPQHFFIQSLKMEQEGADFLDNVAQIVTELPYYNIKLLPPSILKSELDFSLEGKDIRMGLLSVKGASGGAALKIQKFVDTKKVDKFQVFKAAKDSKIDARVFSALSEVGCFQEFEKDRHKLSLEYRIFGSIFTEKEKNYCLMNGKKYGYDLIAALKDYLNWVSSDGKVIGKPSRLETIRAKAKDYIALYRENCRLPQISTYLFEKELLGFSFSYNLSELFKEHGQLQKIKQALESSERTPIKVVAHILDVLISTTKKGQRKIRIIAGDETGSLTFLMLGDKADAYLSTLANPKKDLTEGKIVLLVGSKAEGELVWCDKISIQDLNIYSRVNDLRKCVAKVKEEDFESQEAQPHDEVELGI